MRTLIITLACLLLATPSQAEGKTIAQAEQTEQQLRIQEERLKNIEEQASTERQQIEVWYRRSLIELRQLAERKAKQLKLDNRSLWIEFVKMNEQTSQFDTYFKMNDQIPNAYGYFMNTTTVFLRDVETFELRAALADSYFLSAAANLLMDKNFRRRLADLADGSAYNPQSLPIRSEARKLLHFVNEYESRLAALQDRRTAKLAGVEQWKQGLKADVLRVMREIKAAPEKVNKGVVSAIICNQKSQLCMVDGIDRILKEGDSIGNIVIVKIYPDQVEFARGSQKWAQLVGKPASDAWR